MFNFFKRNRPATVTHHNRVAGGGEAASSLKPLRQVVLVDVDGTLSPNQYGQPTGEEDYYASVSGWNGNHYVPAKLFEDLQNLPAPKFWLTSWFDDAEDTFVTGWPVIGDEQVSEEWKLDAAARFFAKNPSIDTVVWFDDESSCWDLGPMRERFPDIGFYVPRLMTTKGVGPDEIEQARDFLVSRAHTEIDEMEKD